MNTIPNPTKDGKKFSICELGEYRPFTPDTSLPPSVWHKALQSVPPQIENHPEKPPDEVMSLIQARERARIDKLWAKADELRHQIEQLGWEVSDTKNGPLIKGIINHN